MKQEFFTAREDAALIVRENGDARLHQPYVSTYELRQHVVDLKGRFFPLSWARYDLAKPVLSALFHQNLEGLNWRRIILRCGLLFLNDPPFFVSVHKP